MEWSHTITKMLSRLNVTVVIKEEDDITTIPPSIMEFNEFTDFSDSARFNEFTDFSDSARFNEFTDFSASARFNDCTDFSDSARFLTSTLLLYIRHLYCHKKLLSQIYIEGLCYSDIFI